MTKQQKTLREIYWLIGRADPTKEDLAGAAKQVAALIEARHEDIATCVCSEQHGWSMPLFK